MAGMTKRMYEMIGEAIASLPATATRDEVTEKLADTFAADNPEFRRRRFVTQARNELDDWACRKYGYHIRSTRHTPQDCGQPAVKPLI